MTGKPWADMTREERRDRERTPYELILENKLRALYVSLESVLVEALENREEPSLMLIEETHTWVNDLYQSGLIYPERWREGQHRVNIASQLTDSSNPCVCDFDWWNQQHTPECAALDEESPYYD